MYYKNVLKKGFVDEYIKMHRHFYNELYKIVQDIVILESALRVHLLNVRASYLIKHIHNNLKEYLIIKIQREIFDCGSNSVSLSKFKNKIKDNIIPENRNELSKEIKKVWNVAQKNDIEKKLRDMRNQAFAHSLEENFDDKNVLKTDLIELRKIIEMACDLFSVLSFSVEDAYSYDEHYELNMFEYINKLCAKDAEDIFKAQLICSKE